MFNFDKVRQLKAIVSRQENELVEYRKTLVLVKRAVDVFNCITSFDILYKRSNNWILSRHLDEVESEKKEAKEKAKIEEIAEGVCKKYYQLSPSGRDLLEDAAAAIEEYAKYCFEVTGNTESTEYVTAKHLAKKIRKLKG